jgi:hypothetical protein
MFGSFTALKVLEDKSLDEFVEMMKRIAQHE